MRFQMKRLIKDSRGQGAVEYIILFALAGLSCIVFLRIGGSIISLYFETLVFIYA
ncbi:MAG: class III signal peptide-containing protein, partial [bacterium]